MGRRAGRAPRRRAASASRSSTPASPTPTAAASAARPTLGASRLLRGHDFVGDDPYPNDENGHGTLVASTIAAAANNGYGMVGVAYAARILPVRVLDAHGEGGSARIAEGIRYAVNRGAQVINVSIEFSARAPPARASIPEIREAIRYAHSQGVVVVGASGNLGAGATSPPGALGATSSTSAGRPSTAASATTPTTARASTSSPPAAARTPPLSERRELPTRPPRRAQHPRGHVPPLDAGAFLVPADFHGTSMAAPHVDRRARW